MTTQSRIVKEVVESLLDMGFTDKDSIIKKTVEQTGIPRPTVRRIIRDMRNEMQRRIKILQADPTYLPE